MTQTILMDLDGTICQYDFPKLLEKYFHCSIPNGDIYAYALEDVLGVTPAEIAKMFKVEVYNRPCLIEGAISTINSFISKDYQVGIYSNRIHYMSMVELEDWMEAYGIPYSYVATKDDLPDYVYAHVDDNPSKLMELTELTKVKYSILLNQPWNNKCLNITGKLQRAMNWQEVRNIIDVYPR